MTIFILFTACILDLFKLTATLYEDRTVMGAKAVHIFIMIKTS